MTARRGQDAPDAPPYYAIRDSPIHGRGAFATVAIPAGTRLLEYAGRRLTPAQADEIYPDPVPGSPEAATAPAHHTFLFAIDDDVVVDASVDGNDARWINHGCDPNCDAVIDDAPDGVPRIWIETIRDVAPGEELVYDYAFVLPERHTPAAKRRYPCRCGAAPGRCRGTILAKKR